MDVEVKRDGLTLKGRLDRPDAEKCPAATLKTDALKGICMGTEYDTAHIPEIVTLEESGQRVGGHCFRIAKCLPIYEVTAEFQKPALIILGKKDELVTEESSRRYVKAMKQASLLLFDDLDHGMEGTDQKRVLESIADFLTESA